MLSFIIGITFHLTKLTLTEINLTHLFVKSSCIQKTSSEKCKFLMLLFLCCTFLIPPSFKRSRLYNEMNRINYHSQITKTRQCLSLNIEVEKKIACKNANYFLIHDNTITNEKTLAGDFRLSIIVSIYSLIAFVILTKINFESR